MYRIVSYRNGAATWRTQRTIPLLSANGKEYWIMIQNRHGSAYWNINILFQYPYALADPEAGNRGLWAHGERGGPGIEPLVRGQGGEVHLKLKAFWQLCAEFLLKYFFWIFLSCSDAVSSLRAIKRNVGVLATAGDWKGVWPDCSPSSIQQCRYVVFYCQTKWQNCWYVLILIWCLLFSVILCRS